MLGAMVPISYAEQQSQEIQAEAPNISDAGVNQISVTAATATAGALLITELVPDSKNFNGADAYEFVEVYNNTKSALNFNDFYFYYNDKDNWNVTGDVIIPAGGNVVFWVMNGTNLELTAQNFIDNYKPQATLEEGVNLFRINGNGGMANTSARNLQIKSKVDNTLISAVSYTPAQVKENKGIVYKYPSIGGTAMEAMPESGTIDATPGTVMESQISKPDPEQPAIEIVHTPELAVDPADLVIQATVNHVNSSNPPAVELLYHSPSQKRSIVIAMKNISGSEYTATIPADALEETELNYSIRVQNTVQNYSVPVKQPVFNPAAVPPLLITELLPNSTNVPGTSTDAFEFIEVYNNTDQPINFQNYKIYYRYPDKGPSADVKWPSTETKFIIPAQKSVVFWIINSGNTAYTASDFNKEFKTSLVEGTDLFIIKSDGMSNSGRRAVVIKSNTENEVASAYYDADLTYDAGSKGDETKENKAILYKYPVNGSGKMLKVSSGAALPTPGVVDPQQVPVTPVHVEPDTQPPVVKDFTDVAEVDQSINVEFRVSAEDDKAVRSVELRISSDIQPEYISYNLSQDYNDRLYHYKLSSADLIGRSEIKYYFVASDGINETASPEKSIKVTGGPDKSPLRLNIKNDTLINGTATVKGTAASAAASELSLSIDDKKVTDGTHSELEYDAFFVFDAKNVDYYFKNAITMGPEELGEKSILYTFMDPIPTYTTLSFKIPAEKLQAGPDNVIYIRAGSKSSPFDPRPEENKDDFEVRNVRLILADGTELWDPAYNVRNQEIKIGDSPGKKEAIGFKFNLNDDLLRAKTYKWDTSKVADGKHTLTVGLGQNQVTSTVTVDNTPPSIQATVKDGQVYRGNFVIDAVITDAIAGIKQSAAKLDGVEIQLPYATSSGALSPGKHQLIIKASDKLNNEVEQSIQFEVPDENPLAPQVVSPELGARGVATNPELKVKVEDPTGDKMDVTFYKGFKYDGNHPEQGFKGFLNASDTEPPKQEVPAGEQALTKEDYSKISKADGDYLVNESVEQFPYQRFEIALDESVKATDRVEINWKGNSLPGRKVSLYAWSPTEKKWDLLNFRIASNEDFELNATVLAGTYDLNHKISVMVQDEIAPVTGSTEGGAGSENYDFSFLWMSDTQYYSQSYPYIYRKNVEWIAENKENLKLKYVIHTGDVVDKMYQEYEWKEADRNMKVLEDAKIPYGVLAGNHDVNHQLNDYSKFGEYFGDWRFKDSPVFGGSYDNNRGHYDLVSADGNDFVIVYMGWGLADQEIEWMNEIVARYPERKAILCLHEYLLVSNNRAPIADKIFEKVVKPNKNVIAALSGHYHDAQLKIDQLDDDGDGVPDRNVYQMLADYQGAPEGGLGFIRLLQFDIANNKLHVKTYSPYLDQYNYYDPKDYPGKDEFSLDLDLQPVGKRVATDYIGIKVYTDQKIAVQTAVESGKVAAAVWNGLKPNSYYQWYVQADDKHSGIVNSDIWGFYTGDQTTTNPGTDPNYPGNNQGNGPDTKPEKPDDKPEKPESKPEEKPETNPEPKPETNPENGGAAIKDLTGHWAENVIRSAVASGIVQGNGEGQFLPNKLVDRSEFAVMLARALKLPASSNEQQFKDASKIPAWARAAVSQAAEAGIINGFADGTFGPAKQLSRAELAVMIVRASGISVNPAAELSFKDAKDIPKWAAPYVAAAVESGLINGVGANKFAPLQLATRAEAVVLITSMLSKK